MLVHEHLDAELARLRGVHHVSLPAQGQLQSFPYRRVVFYHQYLGHGAIIRKSARRGDPGGSCSKTMTSL
ncbi:hypothetical protein Amsp01_051000 [Amycolatopsis sp. NBRC 101858]|nr:hypothetical protein Amsp01_051000 [Amycolatopsis sp. NBRC 101858]